MIVATLPLAWISIPTAPALFQPEHGAVAERMRDVVDRGYRVTAIHVVFIKHEELDSKVWIMRQ